MSTEERWFLASRIAEQLNDFSGFKLVSGQFIKRVGDGAGNLNSDIYQASGGVFTSIPGAITNVEGNVEQSVSVYEIKFGNITRNIA